MNRDEFKSLITESHELYPDEIGLATDEIIKEAYDFYNELQKVDIDCYHICTGPNGEILLEYQKDDISVEVYFEEDGSEMITWIGDDSTIGVTNIEYLVSLFSDKV